MLSIAEVSLLRCLHRVAVPAAVAADDKIGMA